MEIRNQRSEILMDPLEIRNQKSGIRNPVEIRNPTEIRNPREIRRYNSESKLQTASQHSIQVSNDCIFEVLLFESKRT